MRIYLSEILAAVGWGALVLHLRRCRKQRQIQEAWWRDYQRQISHRWESYAPERLEGRGQN